MLKGELLISGMEENKDLTVSFCRADGYVVARTAKSFSASCPAEFSAERVTKAKRSFRLNFLTLSVPLTPPAGEGAYAEQKRLRLNGVTMPVGVTVSTVQEKAPADISLSESRAQLNPPKQICAPTVAAARSRAASPALRISAQASRWR